MAFSITQEFPLTFGEGWWNLKERLVAAGATVKLSNDTVTAGAGDNLDPGGPYAGSLDNVNAWFVIQFPAVAGVVREILVQITFSTQDRPRIFRSADGIGFSGGDTTNRPTAADEQFVSDGGFSRVFPSSTEYPAQVTYWIGDAAEGYSWMVEPREFAVFPQSLVFMDVVLGPNPNDIDPCVYGCFHIGSSGVYAVNGNLTTRTTVNQTANNISGIGPSGAWVAYPLQFLGVTSDSFHNDRRPQVPGLGFWKSPAMYMRGDPIGFSPDFDFGAKGRSRLFKVIGTFASDGIPLVNQNGTERCVSGIIVPWSPALPRTWS